MPSSDRAARKSPDLATLVRRRGWVVLVAVIISVGTALTISLLQTPVYESRTRVLLGSRQLLPEGKPRPAPLASVETEIQVLVSEPVRGKVRQRLGQEAPSIAAHPVGQSAVFEIVGRGSEPERAAAVARAYADSYLEYRRQQGGIPPNGAAGDQEPRLVQAATAPADPVRPRTAHNAALAAGIGLVCGMGLAVGFERLDDSLQTPEHLEAVAGLPVLAQVPVVSGWRRRGEARTVSLASPESESAAAYKALRTSIRFLSLGRPVRAIQVTSPNRGEGKSATAANLAVMLARAGERVVLVGCDLRRPRVHEFFDLANDVGFTSVLLGEAPLSAALQRVPGEDRLLVLASGPAPPSGAELLASSRAVDVLGALLAHADTLVVDSAPVLGTTEGTLLAPRVEGVVLVASARSSTRGDIARAVEALRKAAAPLVGTVLNEAGRERRPRPAEPRGSRADDGQPPPPTPPSPPSPPPRRPPAPARGHSRSPIP